MTVHIRVYSLALLVRDADGSRVLDEPSLRRLHGFVYSDCDLAEYLQDGEYTRHLSDLGVEGGRITLGFPGEWDVLACTVEYSSPRELTEIELEELREYTNGQLVDGVGESCIACPFDSSLSIHLVGGDCVTIQQHVDA